MVKTSKTSLVAFLLICYAGVLSSALDIAALSACDDTIFQRPDYLSVNGKAEYSVPAEQVILALGLDVVKKNAAEAVQESANIMERVIQAIQALGVQTDEIETSQLTVQEKTEYIYNENTGESKENFLGFEVKQTLTIKTRLVDQAGAIVDAAINNGMNRIDSVSYDATDATKQQIQQALIPEAIRDAEEKANRALTSVGYRIKSVKNVSLNDWVYFQPVAGESYKSYAASGTQTQVYSETQVIRAQVTVSYIIERQI